MLLDLNRKFVSVTDWKISCSTCHLHRYQSASDALYWGWFSFLCVFLLYTRIYAYTCIYLYVNRYLFFALYLCKTYYQRTCLKLSAAPNLSQCFLWFSLHLSLRLVIILTWSSCFHLPFLFLASDTWKASRSVSVCSFWILGTTLISPNFKYLWQRDLCWSLTAPTTVSEENQSLLETHPSGCPCAIAFHWEGREHSLRWPDSDANIQTGEVNYTVCFRFLLIPCF